MGFRGGSGYSRGGAEESLDKYIGASLEIAHGEEIKAVDQSHNKNIALATSHVQAHTDTPASYIKRVDAAIASQDAQAIVTVAQSHNKNAAIASSYTTNVA